MAKNIFESFERDRQPVPGWVKVGASIVYGLVLLALIALCILAAAMLTGCR